MDEVDHDQLFKTVIREFFPDFLRLFFPEQAAKLDLESVRWLDKEVFSLPPEGSVHILDLVAELKQLSGDHTESILALVHVEIESADSATSIESRLPEYYHLLRRTQQKPVQPIVVFLKLGFQGLGVREIHDPPVGEPVMTFRYKYVGLPSLPADTYLRGDNWLGVALSALMKAPKDQRIANGVTAIERLGESPLPDGLKSLLGDCVETYIDIPEEESARFQAILEMNATGRVPPMHKTRVQLAEERGKKVGRQEGREEGREEGKVEMGRESILNTLLGRFGVVPQDIVDHVNSLNDPIALKSISFAIGKSESLEQFREAIGLPSV